jgi:hypothetical protein
MHLGKGKWLVDCNTQGCQGVNMGGIPFFGHNLAIGKGGGITRDDCIFLHHFITFIKHMIAFAMICFVVACI